jgi:hypothetical protein
VAIVNGYATRGQLREWLGLDPEAESEHDGLIDSTVNAVSRFTDAFCHRHFYKVEETRLYRSDHPQVLRLGTFGDIAELAELRTDDDGDGTAETVWDESEFQTHPLRRTAGPEQRPIEAIHAVGRRFPSPRWGQGLIEVEAEWGWPEVPEAVHRATLIQGARIFKRKEAPEGIIGLNQFGVLRVAGRPDPDYVALLLPYRLVVVG